jgi:hypothetical protein
LEYLGQVPLGCKIASLLFCFLAESAAFHTHSEEGGSLIVQEPTVTEKCRTAVKRYSFILIYI